MENQLEALRKQRLHHLLQRGRLLAPTGQNPFSMPGRGRLIGTQVSAEALAKVLADQLGRSVEDETGLKGVFDFKLEWAPEAPSVAGGPMGVPMAPVAPSLFTAIQEQLGLKLEGRRGKGTVLVIDRIESVPSEN
jgi:uncharacterized protein (TIGR03435 family)